MRVKKEIVGKEVLDGSAVSMGGVKDIEVNFDTKEIESLVVGKGGISESIGFSKSEIIVPFEMIKEIGDKIILKDVVNK
jgi:sporulation protein YlmC with PRC-barrel domain